MLIASMNPCPCGYFGQSGDRCTCGAAQVTRYRSKISGPLMDRIDLQIEVQPVPADTLTGEGTSESSSEIRERVEAARTIQNTRYGGEYNTNAQIPAVDLKKYCKISRSDTQFINAAITKLNLSARAYSRILKVARTIADLDHSDNITTNHLAEAIQYRGIDRRSY